MAERDCFTLIKDITPDDVSDELVADVVEKLEQMKERLSPVELQKKAQEYFKILKDAHAKERASQLHDIGIINENRDFVDQFVADGGKNPMDSVFTKLIGNNRVIEGEAISAEAISKAARDKYVQIFHNEVEELGLFDTLERGDLDAQIFTYVMSQDPRAIPSKLEISPEAKQLGDAAIKVMNGLFEDLKRAGSQIERLPGYVARQHDLGKIIATDMRTWIDDIKQALDLDRTFPELPEIEINSVLEKTYADMQKNLLEPNIPKDIDSKFTNLKVSKTLDQYISKHRVFHFKNGESLFQYNQKYGARNFKDGVISYIMKTSKQLGLLEQFGHAPTQNINDMVQYAAKKATELYGPDSPQVRRALMGKGTRLGLSVTNVVKELKGQTNIPGRSMAAVAAKNVRAINNMSMLGKVALASMADLGNASVMISSFTGKNIMSSVGDAIQEGFKLIPKGEVKKWGKRLELVTNDMMGELGSHRLMGGETFSGKIAATQTKLMKLTGLPWLDERTKVAVAKIFANEFTDFIETGVKNERMMGNLSRLNFREPEFAALKDAVELFEDGSRVVTPESIRNLPESTMTKYKAATGSEKSIGDLREDLARNYQIYLRGNADAAIPTPGAEQRAILLQGTMEDEPMGIVLRQATQFKSFSMKMLSNLERATLSKPGVEAQNLIDVLKGKGDTQMLVNAMVLGTATGYMSLVASELADGKTPRSPFDRKTLMESWVRGGTATLYGDLLFSEYDSIYRKFSATLGGPTVPLIDSSAVVLSKMFRVGANGDISASEDAGKVMSESLKVMMRTIPGQNLFWTKWAVDYYFLNTLKEYLNPGHALRMERNVAKHKGVFGPEQRYFLSPTDRI